MDEELTQYLGKIFNKIDEGFEIPKIEAINSESAPGGINPDIKETKDIINTLFNNIDEFLEN